MGIDSEDLTDVCLKCAWCCKHDTFSFSDVPEDAIALMKTKGYEVLDDRNNVIHITIKHRCPHLQDDNKCDLYGTGNRPTLCRENKDGNDIGSLPAIVNCLKLRR